MDEIVGLHPVEPQAASPRGDDGVSPAEQALAGLLADVVGTEQVSVDSHFFDDLGADSMTMTQFCARVRKRTDLPAISIKDVYRHPTVRSLAGAVISPRLETQTLAAASAEASAPSRSPDMSRGSAQDGAIATRVSRRSGTHVACGFVQLLTFAAYACLAGLLVDRAGSWIVGASDLPEMYLRSVIAGILGLFTTCAVPIVAKWVLVRRWRPERFAVWSLAYCRFWIVKTLVVANPVALFFVGTPVFALYLRALGARVGRGVAVFTRHIPVCTDLISIGDNTVIRKDSSLPGYHARDGAIEIGGVQLGSDVYIGEKSTLDIHTAMGDGAQLGHASVLYPGQRIPAAQRWHGSPARRTDVDHRRVASARCGRLRRVAFSVFTLLKLVLVYIPLGEGVTAVVIRAAPSLDRARGSAWDVLGSAELYVDALVISAALFFGFVIGGVLFVVTVPRIFARCIEPDRVYPLYGLQYGAHRTVSRITNVRLFTWLFGDSSYIVHYLRALGYDLNEVEQTGSNFGTEVQHDTPYLSSVGSGTMVADGLSVVNADYSSTSFRVARTAIGAQNFLGNNIAYPSGGRVGDNCLLATKVMVPLDGEIRHDVGLLGSPPFEIPRTVERDRRFDHLRSGDEHRTRLAAKNRYNLRSMGLFLLIRWFDVFLLTLIGCAAIVLEPDLGFWAIAGYPVVGLVVSPMFFVLVERRYTLHRLEPRICSIYDPYFWWHERLWKVPDNYLNIYNGTPFKAIIWRLLGVRIGRRVFDDGVFITERTLATIGDDAVLNHASKIQCHSQEDGTFKSGRTSVGARCTLGVAAFVHYGVTIGDGATLAADSFLMKGEEVPPGANWGGNPAEDREEAAVTANGGFARARVG